MPAVFANRRNKNPPIVGKASAKSISSGYSIASIRGNEVLRVKKYRKRIADDILARKLEGKGAVLIEGPK